MVKKLHLDENFDNVQVDVQAVANPVFVNANKEHDENKKNYEDAMKENEKATEDLTPEEGESIEVEKRGVLKKMHLSEAMFDESFGGNREEVKAFINNMIDEKINDNLVMVVYDALPAYDPDLSADAGDEEASLKVGRAQEEFVNALLDYLFAANVNESLTESLEEIDRQAFGSLNKETKEPGVYYVLRDGNFDHKIYADSDEEAKAKWHNELNENLTEGIKSNDLEVNLINYIKKFQKHYNIDSQSMGKALAQIGKSIEILNPGDSMNESLSFETQSDLTHDIYQSLERIATKYDRLDDFTFEDLESATDEALMHLADVFGLVESLDEGMPSPSLNGRVRNAKLMHEVMMSMNDENAYYDWIYTMPDEPTEEDFEWFASDDAEYKELVNTFKRIFNRYKKDGLYQPSEDVKNFLKSYNVDIEILESVNEDLNESLIYNVAKEQIKRFNEGKMGDSWNPNTYVERLVNKKYLNESQASSLLESVNK